MKADGSKVSAANTPVQTLFTLLLGLLLGLALLKFGNPVIFESKITSPKTVSEAWYETWPLAWAYAAVIPVAVLGLIVARWEIGIPKWLFFLPLAWLVWQFVSATHSVAPHLTAATLKHFTVCVGLFYLGALSMAHVPRTSLLWIGILLGFLLVIRTGFYQHFTLEAERQFFLSVNWDDPPPEIREKFTEEQLRVFRTEEFKKKRLLSERISGTLFYPNTLAGAILLFLPISLAVVWQLGTRLRPVLRWLAVALLALTALTCLYWSGSKSGWLLMLTLGFIALLHNTRLSKRTKIGIATAVVILGIGGFAVKFAGFFQKGATSVVARTEYWKAAMTIFKANPVFGTGPGTFAIPYAQIKPAEAEMARLCHNDCLEQAADSGVLGLAIFCVFVGTCFFLLYRERNTEILNFCILLGLSGLFLQSFMEFNLYIPALAWPGFLFLGWMLVQTASPTPSATVSLANSKK